MSYETLIDNTNTIVSQDIDSILSEIEAEMALVTESSQPVALAA